jgi:HSP20 family protein
MTYTFPIAASFPNASLRRDIDRLFVDAFTGRPAAQWQPHVTAREDGQGYTFEADLPGVAPETVEVLAEDGVLTLRGTRVFRSLAAGEKALLTEAPSGAFQRRFALPKQADLQAVEASYQLGVLTVRVAKVAPAQPRRVPVTVTPAAEGQSAE